MTGPLKTLSQARNYASMIEATTGNKHYVFRLPKGSMAYQLGWRFGTCLADEREDYAADGAVFIDEPSS